MYKRQIHNSGFKLEMGALLENVIYNELLNRGYEVYIGKVPNGEIDFVALKAVSYTHLGWDIKRCEAVRNSFF